VCSGYDKLHAFIYKSFGRIAKNNIKIFAGKISTHGFTTGRKYYNGAFIGWYNMTDGRALFGCKMGK
jgi:hypothetical protein